MNTKDMSKIYFSLPTKQLLTMRSVKAREIERLEAKQRGNFENRDLRVLRQQIVWINAVLESRNCQIGLFD